MFKNNNVTLCLYVTLLHDKKQKYNINLCIKYDSKVISFNTASKMKKKIEQFVKKKHEKALKTKINCNKEILKLYFLGSK